MMKKKWLKGCVISLLAAGVVSVGGAAQAKVEIIDFSGSNSPFDSMGVYDKAPKESLVIFSHDTKRPQDPNQGLIIFGSRLKFEKADPNSLVTIRTDNAGLNTSSTDPAEQNLVYATLNNLANRFFYGNYREGERNLTGKVEIAEGLTSQSVSMIIKDMTFKNDGQGQFIYTPVGMSNKFGTAILGNPDRDQKYVEAGILTDGVYNFTKPETTITIDGTVDKAEVKRALVLTQYGQIAAAISGSLPKYDEAGSEIIYDYDTAVSNRVKMDLHGNNLNVLLKDDSGFSLSGIAAIAGTKKPETAGKVEIDNAGAMQIEVNGKGSTSALFAGNGGKLIIHNGGEKPRKKFLRFVDVQRVKDKASVLMQKLALPLQNPGRESKQN